MTRCQFGCSAAPSLPAPPWSGWSCSGRVCPGIGRVCSSHPWTPYRTSFGSRSRTASSATCPCGAPRPPSTRPGGRPAPGGRLPSSRIVGTTAGTTGSRQRRHGSSTGGRGQCRHGRRGRGICGRARGGGRRKFVIFLVLTLQSIPPAVQLVWCRLVVAVSALAVLPLLFTWIAALHPRFTCLGSPGLLTAVLAPPPPPVFGFGVWFSVGVQSGVQDVAHWGEPPLPCPLCNFQRACHPPPPRGAVFGAGRTGPPPPPRQGCRPLTRNEAQSCQAHGRWRFMVASGGALQSPWT